MRLGSCAPEVVQRLRAISLVGENRERELVGTHDGDAPDVAPMNQDFPLEENEGTLAASLTNFEVTIPMNTKSLRR